MTESQVLTAVLIALLSGLLAGVVPGRHARTLIALVALGNMVFWIGYGYWVLGMPKTLLQGAAQVLLLLPGMCLFIGVPSALGGFLARLVVRRGQAPTLRVEAGSPSKRQIGV